MKTVQSEKQSAAPLKGKVPAIAINVLSAVATGLTVLAAMTAPMQAASINIPNGSFELQSAVGQNPPVNINIDSWQKAPKPAYFDAIEVNYGIYWVQTAGVFVGTNYANCAGNQAAYMLSFPQVTLFQDLTAADAKFAVDTSYSFTLGVFGKGMSNNVSTLALSLYYRDNLDNMVTVGTPATVTYTEAGFPATNPLNLFDYTVNIPAVQAGDAWAGKPIGLRIESTVGTGAGYWDMDNARLLATPVPEPATWSLLGLGFGGWLLLRARARKA